jgi:hypothetical protein
MDVRTTIRELDELIRRTECVLNREEATLLALPPSRVNREKQQRVRSMLTQLRRLRNQRRLLPNPRQTIV